MPVDFAKDDAGDYSDYFESEEVQEEMSNPDTPTKSRSKSPAFGGVDVVEDEFGFNMEDSQKDDDGNVKGWNYRRQSGSFDKEHFPESKNVSQVATTTQSTSMSKAGHSMMSTTNSSWQGQSTQSMSMSQMGFSFFWPTDPRILAWNRRHAITKRNEGVQVGLRNYFSKAQTEKELFEYLAVTPTCKSLLSRIQSQPQFVDPKRAPSKVGTMPGRYEPCRLDSRTPYWNNRWQIDTKRGSRKANAEARPGQNLLRMNSIPPEMLSTLYQLF